jgi:hypothetical protein
MCVRLTSLLLATAWVAGVGCASKSAEEPSAPAATDHGCATSATVSHANDHDTDIDSILTQPTSDRRLAQINRSLYQSLRTLEAELRRERELAACQPHPLDSAALQAQTNNQQDSGGGAASAEQRAGDAGLAAGAAVGGTAHATANAAAAHATSMHEARLSNGGGGNGATALKVVPGNDNDIVARRLRKAAEQETNPALRAKLWKEYTDYRQGTSVK